MARGAHYSARKICSQIWEGSFYSVCFKERGPRMSDTDPQGMRCPSDTQQWSTVRRLTLGDCRPTKGLIRAFLQREVPLLSRETHTTLAIPGFMEPRMVFRNGALFRYKKLSCPIDLVAPVAAGGYCFLLTARSWHWPHCLSDSVIPASAAAD